MKGTREKTQKGGGRCPFKGPGEGTAANGYWGMTVNSKALKRAYWRQLSKKALVRTTSKGRLNVRVTALARR
jgi:hypothetical protein